MLSPEVSAGIKKYGVLKWGSMHYPHFVFAFAAGIFGSAFGLWCAYLETQKHPKAPYVAGYLVLRPDDERLKYIKVWGENETSEYNK